MWIEAGTPLGASLSPPRQHRDFASVCIRGQIRSDAQVPFPMRRIKADSSTCVYFARRLPTMGLRRHRNIILRRGVLKIYESRLLLKHTLRRLRVSTHTPWCTSVAN